MTLFDTHVHTKESSTCGRVPAKEMVRIYKKAGYTGIVITDHLTPGYWDDAKAGGVSWEDFAKSHMKGYLEAKDEGEKIGLRVLYGCELRFTCDAPNDYLVYGMTNQFIVDNPDIFDWNAKIFRNKTENLGVVTFQAHPFRNEMKINYPEDLFGIEVYNATYGKDRFKRNVIAEMWADMYNLAKIAGSDCHGKEQTARAGVGFYKDVQTIEDFVTEISAQRCVLLKNPIRQSVYEDIISK